MSYITNATTSPSFHGQSDKIEKSKLGLASDLNNFLKLFTTHLKNQDPTDPQDTDKMAQTIATFTVAEQNVALNSTASEIKNVLENSKFNNATSMLNKNVIYDSSIIQHKHQEKNSFSYKLEPEKYQNIANTLVRVVDANGMIVKELEGEKSAGEHQILWDGTDTRGKLAPTGDYQVRIISFDSSGNAVKVGSPEAQGQVNAVENSNGVIRLDVGGKKISYSQVSEIRSM